MKTTKILAAALMLLTVLSCQKEEQTLTTSKTEEGVLITCTFAVNDEATKTTVDTDGLTPKWAADDEIMLYNGTTYSKLTLATSGTPSSTVGVIDANDATKFTFVKPSGWTNLYAVYPYSAVTNADSELKITFGCTNTVGQDGSFGKANICAAKESSGTMSFKNVGAILKFPSKPSTVTKVTVPVAGLANNYKVTFDGTTPSLTSESGSYSNEYTIGEGTGAVYIGVPAGDIAAGSAFIYKDATSVLGSYITGLANTTVVNNIHTLPAIEANGKLTGVFSIGSNAGDKIRFSKGNMYYDGSAFQFEDNQYSSASTWSTSHVSHFYWSKDSTVAYAEGYTDDSASENDVFFTNDPSDETKPKSTFKVDGATGVWRTLSKGEWQYLLSASPTGRGDGDTKFKKVVEVCGKTNCLVIAPDGNTTPIASSYDATTWATAEANGFVCLPAAGGRNVSDVVYVGDFADYCSSTAFNDVSAYTLDFDSDDVDPDYENSRYNGSSVRLVCAAQ